LFADLVKIDTFDNPVNIPKREEFMTTLTGVLRQLKNQRQRAQTEVERIDAAIAALSGSGWKRTGNSGSRRLSAAARRRIAAAQRARWAKIKKAA